MAVAKDKKAASKAEPKAKPQAQQPTLAAGSVSKNPMTQGPARLYGDGDPEQEIPPTPPKGTAAPRTPKPAPKAAPKGEAAVKPREAVAKGSKTPAVRTTKPKA